MSRKRTTATPAHHKRYTDEMHSDANRYGELIACMAERYAEGVNDEPTFHIADSLSHAHPDIFADWHAASQLCSLYAILQESTRIAGANIESARIDMTPAKRNGIRGWLDNIDKTLTDIAAMEAKEPRAAIMLIKRKRLMFVATPLLDIRAIRALIGNK